MLKIRKSKIKVVGAITFLNLLSISYVGLSFYSIPEKVSATDSNGIEEWRGLEDITYMQDMTVDICNNTKTGISKSLQDKRDGSEYYVQKLEDGNCWMLQNLKLTKEGIESWKSSNPDDLNTIKLTSKYSNVADGSTYTLPTSSQSSFNTTATVNATFASTTAAYGTYYSWCAATAGTCSSATSANQEASASVCPKGWRLPTSNKSSGATGYDYSFSNLTDKLGFTNDAAGSTKLRGEPYNFRLAGNVYSGSLSNVGSNGSYWSSTASSSTNAYSLSFKSGNVYPSVNSSRDYGFSVRCVNNPDIHSDFIPPTDERHTDVAVHVGPTISIDAVTSLYGEVDYTKVLEDNITATVSSNNPYKLLLSATQTSLLDATQPDNTGIPTVTTNQAIEKGTSAWGIYSGSVDAENNKTYDPIKTTPSKYYYTDALAADGVAITSSFGIAIAVSPSIPNGTYSTSVTVTAVNG